MSKPRTILVPIDFSEASKKAVRFVLDHHYDDKSRVVLIHAYRLITEEYSPLNDSPFALKSSIEKQLQAQYKTFSEELNLASFKKVEFMMEVGFLVNCLRSICNESGIDLIAYGLKGNKATQALVELIDSGCTKIAIIPDAFDNNSSSKLNEVRLTQQEMMEQHKQYLSDSTVNQDTILMVAP